MKANYFFICVLFTLFFVQCKPKSSIAVTGNNNGPASFTPKQIGLNEVKVQGQLIKENDIDYLVIDKVLLRGRSAPVISSGQRVKLNTIDTPVPPYNKVIKGLITCKSIPETNDYSWSFKPINK